MQYIKITYSRAKENYNLIECEARAYIFDSCTRYVRCQGKLEICAHGMYRYMIP